MLTASPIEEVEMNTTTSPGIVRFVAGSSVWQPQAGSSVWELAQAGASCWKPVAGAVAWR
jgi:hypothetical protein